MRRPALVLALAGLLTACSPGTEDPDGTPTAGPSPVQIEGLETFDDLSNEHVTDPVEYDQVPPVGGAHFPRWLACDVYDEPVPAEGAVHSMEHGAVWITYEPGLEAGGVEQLAALAELDEEYVLVSPLTGLPAPVVASAWGLQVQVDGPDDPRLQQFVQTYAGEEQGGEPGPPPCRTNGLSPGELEQELGS